MTKVANPQGQKKVPNNATANDTKGLGISPATGVFVATVKRNDDPQNMGRLKVFIPNFGSTDPEDDAHWITVGYASPMAGSSSVFEQGKNVEKYSDTMVPFGMWTQPPAVDTQVLVAFAGGRIEQGYWFACLFNRGTQVTVPGIPAKKTYSGENISAAPKNKKDKNPDPDIYVEHKLHSALKKQGLEEDKIRGTSTSSSTRETPSKVMGFLTPGQHQLVMDDGDFRGENRLIRMRTAGGAQLLLDDESGHVYAICKSGESWLELSNDGEIHVFGSGSINLHAGKDLNIRAEKDINLEAGNTLNVSTGKNITLQSGANVQTIAKDNTFITSGAFSHVNSQAGHYESAAVIHMNGPAASQASPLETNTLAVNKGVNESICSAIPEAEPWAGHSGTINPKGFGNSQMNVDPDPTQQPVQPTDKDKGAPLDESKFSQGPDVSVASAKTSAGAVDMIKDRNGFSPVNVLDGAGQSIGFGSVFSENAFEQLAASVPALPGIEGNNILKEKLIGMGDSAAQFLSGENPIKDYAEKLGVAKQFNTDLEQFKTTISDLKAGKQFEGNNFIPNEFAKVLQDGITPLRAEQMLLNDIAVSEKSVKKMLAGIPKVPQNVFDSMVSMHNQLGDASYAYVKGKKLDLTGLYKEGNWNRAASLIAADDRDRTSRIREATLMSMNRLPKLDVDAVVRSGFVKTNALAAVGKLNQQFGTPATAQQQLAVASSYFKQNGVMPTAAITPVRLTVKSGLSNIFKTSKGAWPY